MANTDYLNINRPGVGDPFDKNDSSFVAGTHIDILDEIDRRVGNGLSYLSFHTANTIADISDSVDLHSRYGVYATDGTDVYDLSNGLNKLTTGATKTLMFVSVRGMAPNRVIAVGASGYIIVYNFSSWSEKASNVTDQLNAVAGVGSAWTNAAIIAAGNNGAATKSTDGGDTWTDITSSFATSNHHAQDVDVGGSNGDIMAFATRNTSDSRIDVVYTQDGSSFTTVNTTISGTTIPSILWDGGYWVVVSGQYIAWSSDLSSWNKIDISSADSNYQSNTNGTVARMGSLYVMHRENMQWGFNSSGYIFERYQLVNNSTFDFLDYKPTLHPVGRGWDNDAGKSIYYRFNGSSEYKKTPPLL